MNLVNFMLTLVISGDLLHRRFWIFVLFFLFFGFFFCESVFLESSLRPFQVKSKPLDEVLFYLPSKETYSIFTI